MAATLANNGTNPLTGTQIIEDSLVQNVLSVMATCGMYDFAGEWIYDVGLPAKSGVGGGILAALPGKLGIGVYSPALDEHGNSVRGVQVCKELSKFLGLHLLKAEPDITAALHAQYDALNVSSRRQRNRKEREILDTYGTQVKVLELKGHLTFATTEFVIRQVFNKIKDSQIFLFDFRRVGYIDEPSTSMFVQMLKSLYQSGRTFVLSNLPLQPVLSQRMERALHALEVPEFPIFDELDEALEWAENQVIALHSRSLVGETFVPLAENELCEGLKEEERCLLATLVKERRFKRGTQIIRQDDPADRVFFIGQGEVTVLADRGVRLSTIAAGMSFGELALLDGAARSAHVFASTDVVCWDLPVNALPVTEDIGWRIRSVFLTNLCRILAYRLQGVSSKIDVLSAA